MIPAYRAEIAADDVVADMVADTADTVADRVADTVADTAAAETARRQRLCVSRMKSGKKRSGGTGRLYAAVFPGAAGMGKAEGRNSPLAR